MARDYDIKFMELGQVKEKQFILIDDVICKVDTITKSKPGNTVPQRLEMTATGFYWTKDESVKAKLRRRRNPNT